MPGLREQAEADNKAILGDVIGFGYPVTVKDPGGTVGNLHGFTNDIGQVIDPDTGQIVSGRIATVALNISALADAGLGLPVGISDESIKPWVVTFNDINGNSFTFKVVETQPDRAIGQVVCILDTYEDAA